MSGGGYTVGEKYTAINDKALVSVFGFIGIAAPHNQETRVGLAAVHPSAYLHIHHYQADFLVIRKDGDGGCGCGREEKPDIFEHIGEFDADEGVAVDDEDRVADAHGMSLFRRRFLTASNSAVDKKQM
ncbi:hypothetical protein LJR255_004454 [Pararhizobium sp. LjRoot255]|uniref:hypothetical protein n=1 Tax=Pararhizobium sp. LjRoot255 TaxID=3342298 RepID=UPI003ECD5076